MATPTSIPSDLTNDDKAFLFQLFDACLNSIILYSFLNGVYVQSNLKYLCLITNIHRSLHRNYCYYIEEYLWDNHINCIVQTEENISVLNKSWHIGRIVIIVIILIYVFTIINSTVNWSYIRAGFISNDQNFWTIFSFYANPGVIRQVASGTLATLCNTLADSIMVSITLLNNFTITYYYPNCRFGAVGDSGAS